MEIRINFKSGKPAYLQVVDQIKYAAASGAIKAGEPLPSIRPLAEQLRMNRNTIAKAFNELERQGIIETRPGKESILAQNHSPLKKVARRKMLAESIDTAVVQAYHLQFNAEEFIELARQRLEAMDRESTSKVESKKKADPS
jgi:GntR family transcriptional regulator